LNKKGAYLHGEQFEDKNDHIIGYRRNGTPIYRMAGGAWGDPAVTRLRRQADQSIAYATGVNTPQTLQHVGLLKRLRLITSLNITNVVGNGAVVQDSQGPWNLFANLLIRVSGLDLLYQVSGWGLYLINLVNGYQWAPNSSGVATANTANQQTTTASVFAFPVAGAQAAQTLLFSLDLPFTAPLLGFEDLGLWLIQNETVNMEVVPTYNALGGATLLQQPYVLTGTATATVNSGSTALWREFYGVPQRQEDMPPLGYVHQWEEQFNAITGSQVDIDHQRGGVLLRLLYQIDDADSTGGGNNVLAGITNPNVTSIEFKYDANDTPFDEDVTSILERQRELYGRDLPQGAFTHDFFSQTKTMQDSYNTENYINIKTRFRFAKALVAGSRIRTIRERLLPVVLNTTQ
jgi:hypothetical protein